MDDPIIQLASLAREAVEECGDTDKACNYVRKQLEKDGTLRDLEFALVSRAIRDEVSRICQCMRQAAKSNTFKPCERGLEVIASSAKTKALSMLELWKIPGARVLGDANKVELLEWAAQARICAAGHMENAIFYEAIASKMKPGKKVRDCITPDEAEAMFRNARKRAIEATKQ